MKMIRIFLGGGRGFDIGLDSECMLPMVFLNILMCRLRTRMSLLK